MPRPSEMRSTSVYEVSPGYFDALGVRIVAGRPIDRRDTRTARHVAVVNETFARTVIGTRDTIGKRFFWGWNRSDPIEVVGIVADGKYETLTERPQPAAFQPTLQRYNTTTTLVVRSARPAEEVVPEVRTTIASLDPTLPLYMTGSLHQLLGLALFPSRAADRAQRIRPDSDTSVGDRNPQRRRVRSRAGSQGWAFASRLARSRAAVLQ